MSKIFTCFIYLSLFITLGVNAQNVDIEKLTKKDRLKINGAFNANTVYNSQRFQGMPPLSYFLSGTINFSIWDFQMPLVVNYSNRKFTYSQPFSYNFVSLRPTYKWASAEIGTGYTTFSPYSLNGHQYQGIGLKLTPQKWDISLMYGRLFKSNNGDAANPSNYKRMGMGLKTVYRGDKYSLGFTLFNADDQVNSLSISDSLKPQPKENMVVGLEFGTTLLRRFQLSVDYHSSSINPDKNQIGISNNSNKAISALFLNRNSNVQSYESYKIGLNTNLIKTNTLVGISFQKVDPDYTTFGGYYFVNNFQNLTLNLTQNFFKNKVSLSANAGFQQDNIMPQQSSTQNRFVGNLDLGVRPTEKLNINFSFSNFTSYSFIRTAFDEIRKLNPFEQLDTLNYRQINQSLSTNINYDFEKTEDTQKGIHFDLAVMQSVNRQGEIVRLGQKSGFINSNILYSQSAIRKGQGTSLGLNTSINTVGIENSYSVGPIANLQKNFIKNKLITNSSLSYVYSRDTASKSNAGAANIRANASYNIDKFQTLTCNLGVSSIKSSGYDNKTFVSLTVGYSSRF